MKLIDGVRVQAIAKPSYVPTRFVFGDGASEAFPELFREVIGWSGSKRPMIICGRRSPAKPWLEKLLEGVTSFDPLVIEKHDEYATIDCVTTLLWEARRGMADLVVGIGGGSVMDAAKSVALLVNKPLDLQAALSGAEVNGARLPMIVVPTTAGSGSEATSFATLWDMRKRRKHSLTRSQNYPDLAIVDPLLHASLGRADKVSCAFDALCQAIESCWSRGATEESIGFGIEAIGMLVDGIERFLLAPNDPLSRRQLSKGSLFSGMAIAQSRTTIAHAISYPLTAWYGVRHGHACALTIGALLRFNALVGDDDCCDPRGREYVCGIVKRICGALGVRNPIEGENRLAELLKSCGQQSFADLIQLDIDFLIDDVMSYDRFGNNPRFMGPRELRMMLTDLRYRKSFAGASITSAPPLVNGE
jgi:alcohol dehydrogenase class IV